MLVRKKQYFSHITDESVPLRSNSLKALVIMSLFLLLFMFTDGLGTNKLSYNITNLRHVRKVAAHFPNNNEMFISFIQVYKRRK